MSAPNCEDLRSQLAAASDPTAPPSVLAALTEAFASIGRQALDDRRGHNGRRWGIWTDWCWRNGLPPLPAPPDAAARFIEELAADVGDADEIIEVCAAVAGRHLDSGHADPWGSR